MYTNALKLFDSKLGVYVLHGSLKELVRLQSHNSDPNEQWLTLTSMASVAPGAVKLLETRDRRIRLDYVSRQATNIEACNQHRDIENRNIQVWRHSQD